MNNSQVTQRLRSQLLASHSFIMEQFLLSMRKMRTQMERTDPEFVAYARQEYHKREEEAREGPVWLGQAPKHCNLWSEEQRFLSWVASHDDGFAGLQIALGWTKAMSRLTTTGSTKRHGEDSGDTVGDACEPRAKSRRTDQDRIRM